LEPAFTTTIQDHSTEFLLDKFAYGERDNTVTGGNCNGKACTLGFMVTRGHRKFRFLTQSVKKTIAIGPVSLFFSVLRGNFIQGNNDSLVVV